MTKFDNRLIISFPAQLYEMALWSKACQQGFSERLKMCLQFCSGELSTKLFVDASPFYYAKLI